MMDARVETLLEWRKLYFAELAELKKTALDGIDYQAKFVAEARCEYTRRKLAFLQRRRNERLAEWHAQRTAAALAAAEAEVARLRAALAKFTDDTSDVAFLLTDVLVGFNSLKWQEISEQYSLDDARDSIKAARHTLFAKAVVARAALNPEATHENG
jgi:hypothetical protein